MNILITGSSGMLGFALCKVLSRKDSYNITGLDLIKPDTDSRLSSFINCDITDRPKLLSLVNDTRPDVIIHTAAYTDVDGCELYSTKAEAVNAFGTKNIAEAAFKSNALLMYISSDFVFDGRKKTPYREKDKPNPINIYGKSKLDGERFVEDIMKEKRYFIIRSSWMFGAKGRNFVDIILNKAGIEDKIKVVNDQFGSPTYAFDLACAIVRILDLYKNKKNNIFGIYHITNSDDCSWYRLAQKTLELAGRYGITLIPIMSDELDRPAKRPTMSILDNSRYEGLFGETLRSWEKALEEYILSRKES